MYVICSEVRFVEFSSPNECDKILKIPNEQTEPTDYMTNCSKNYFISIIIVSLISMIYCLENSEKVESTKPANKEKAPHLKMSKQRTFYIYRV